MRPRVALAVSARVVPPMMLGRKVKVRKVNMRRDSREHSTLAQDVRSWKVVLRRIGIRHQS